MSYYKLSAWSVSKEIDLNALAKSFEIPKRFTWEEPIRLYGEVLKNLLQEETVQEGEVFLFYFGSIVLLNGETHWVEKINKYLGKNNLCKLLENWRHFNDEYELVEETGADQCNDSIAKLHSISPYHIELSAITLAKSVALERNELQIEQILNQAESLIERLENGKTRMADKKLGMISASILRHEYDSVSYVLILDKPDITWTVSDANAYYEKLSIIFELADRYEILKQKTDTLRHIVEGFTAVNHGTRSYIMEVVILILILVEVILMLLDLIL
ncbi:RMD1 family protein [Cellulosilyticum sp. I15G10I2]|uniref:RMD1 family protein n=1 Tax=Cellulosilyticum sp. I15G10I2 TaxID=1892843 RepID=UPI00085C4E72|nr:RMD1 family protein [Cellulosilyticum sp. I15G10I2]